MNISNVPPVSSCGNGDAGKKERTALLANISSNVDRNFFEHENQQQRKQTSGNYGSTQPVNGPDDGVSQNSDSYKDGTLHSHTGKGDASRVNNNHNNNNYSQRLLIESQSRWAATIEFLTASLFNTLTYGIWSALDVLLILTMAAYLPSKDVFAGAATAITITAMTVMSVASGMSSALETLISNAYGANKYSRDIAKYLQAATVVNVCLLFAPMAIFLVFFPAHWLTVMFPGAGPASSSKGRSKGVGGNEAMLFDGMLVWLRWSPLVMLPQVFAVGFQKFAICQQKPQVVTRSAAVSLVVLPLLLWLAAREPHRAFSSSSSGLYGFLNALDVFGGSGSVLSFVAAITIDKTILLCVMVGNIIHDDELRANLWGYGRAPPPSSPQTGKQAGTGNVWCSDSYGGRCGGSMANTRQRTRRPENLLPSEDADSGDKRVNDAHTGYNRVISNEEVDECLDKMRATAPTAVYDGSHSYPDDPSHYDDHGAVDFTRRDDSSVAIGGTLKDEYGSEVSSSSPSSFLLYLATYLKVGYPSAIAFCIDTWTFELMTILSARCGPTEAAAWVLMQQLSSPFFALASGLSSAAAAIIGHCHGAGCTVRLVSGRYRIAIVCSTIVGFVSFVILAAAGPSVFAYVIDMSPSLANDTNVAAGHTPRPSSPTPPSASSAGGGGEVGALLLADVKASSSSASSPSSFSHFSASRALQIGEEAMTLFALHIGTDVTFFAMQGVYRGLHLQALQARIVFVSLWVVAVPMAVFWGVLIKGYRATPIVPNAVEAVVGFLSSISTSIFRRNNNNNGNQGGTESSGISTSSLATGCVHGIVVSLLVGTTLGSVLLYVYLKKAEKKRMWLEDEDENDAHGNGTSRNACLSRSGDDENDEAPSRVAGYCFGEILRQLRMQNGTTEASTAAGATTTYTPTNTFISGTTNDKGGGISFGAKGNMLMNEMAGSIRRAERR